MLRIVYTFYFVQYFIFLFTCRDERKFKFIKVTARFTFSFDLRKYSGEFPIKYISFIFVHQ